MASIARYTRRLASARCLQAPGHPTVTARCFSSGAAPTRPLVPQKHARSYPSGGRKFSKLSSLREAAAATNQSQEPPNAQAYLASGAIAGARDLIDVKKVLVIGSGGLAIGQAGEFDYSGKST